MTYAENAPRSHPLLIESDQPTSAIRAAEALRAGEVIAIPTDTVYGLAASLDHPAAIGRLYELKGRPRSKAVPILLGRFEDLQRVAADLSDPAIELANHFWPGALTLVVPAGDGLPSHVTAFTSDGMRTVAVRVPDHGFARAVIAAAGGALAVTSANRTGESPALDAAGVMALAPVRASIVIDGGRVSGCIPSTIVLALASDVRVLRQGAIADEVIMEVLRDPSRRAAGVKAGSHSTV